MTALGEIDEIRRSPFHTDSPRPASLTVSEITLKGLTGLTTLEKKDSVAERLGLNPDSELARQASTHKWLLVAFASAVTNTREVRFIPIVYPAGLKNPKHKPTCIVATDGRGEAVSTLYDLGAITVFLAICFPEDSQQKNPSNHIQTATNLLTDGYSVKIKPQARQRPKRHLDLI